jgi:hypothetical protein
LDVFIIDDDTVEIEEEGFDHLGWDWVLCAFHFVLRTWCFVLGALCLVLGAWCLVLCSVFAERKAPQSKVRRSKRKAQSTKYKVRTTKYEVQTTNSEVRPSAKIEALNFRVSYSVHRTTSASAHSPVRPDVLILQRATIRSSSSPGNPSLLGVGPSRPACFATS